MAQKQKVQMYDHNYALLPGTNFSNHSAKTLKKWAIIYWSLQGLIAKRSE